MSFRRTLTRSLPIVFAGALFLGFAAPAHAASSVRSDVCPSWGCGSITLTFADRDTINPLSESVRDTACDDKHVWIRLDMQYSDGRYHDAPEFLAGGCHESNRVKNTYWEASGDIREARAVLRISDGHSSKFAYGNWVDNPHTS